MHEKDNYTIYAVNLYLHNRMFYKEGKNESLRDAYFYTVEKVELEDIKELLKNYKFEEIDLSKDLGLDKDSKKYSHTFSNDKNEKFSIFIKKTENNKVENIESINYIIEKDKSTEGSLPIIHLSYDNYENTDNVGKLNMIYNNYDIGMFKKLSKIVDDKQSTFYDTYNKIVEDMCDNNDLTLNEIEKMINIKPASDNRLENFGDINSEKYEVTRHTYKDKSEEMYINYINSEKKIGRIILTRMDEENNIQLMKTATISSITDSNINITISSKADNISIQEKFLDSALKK